MKTFAIFVRSDLDGSIWGPCCEYLTHGDAVRGMATMLARSIANNDTFLHFYIQER